MLFHKNIVVRFEKKLFIKSFLSLFFALILFFLPTFKIAYIDDLSDKYFEESIKKAALAYASVRVVNATVSVIQESQLQLEPAGVGVSLAIGQVLDPINDMSERLSDVLVMAITSLGVQKLTYEISVSVTPYLLAFLLLVFSFTVWIKNQKIEKMQIFLLQLSFIILAARLCLPLSALGNEYLYENFFASKIEKSREALQITQLDINALADVKLQEEEGFWSKVTNTTQTIKEKTVAFQKAFVYALENAGSLIEHLLSLTFLYIGVFLIQVILFPLGIFWLFMRSFKLLY